jgi:hypothetical protein
VGRKNKKHCLKMSYASRHSPRFSYAGSPTQNAYPTELLGQTSFWKDTRPKPQPSTSLYKYPLQQQQHPMLMMKDGFMSPDERTLVTILGVGIIVALLFDAVVHTRR